MEKQITILALVTYKKLNTKSNLLNLSNSIYLFCPCQVNILLTNKVMLNQSKVYSHYERCHNSSRESFDFLMGRILTIIDASVTDSRQVKAIKDLVKGEFTDVWSNQIRDQLVCGFRSVAKEVGDSFGETENVLVSSFPIQGPLN